ncbi:MAG: hypothetical protein EOO43_25510 [Flavobacterium sp.]|nr:MAG: hypothetical protein EOO43_25510 [Flavobacterium sp.]
MQLRDVVVNVFPDCGFSGVFDEFKSEHNDEPGTKKDKKVYPDCNPNSRKGPILIVFDEEIFDVDKIGEILGELCKRVGIR